MNRGARVLQLACALLLAPDAAPADQVHLANARTIEGIVIRETDDEVVIQVAWEGHVVLDRETVLEVERSSDEERSELLAGWREEHEAFKQREERERAFEEGQRAKGLILYRGEWITRQELAAASAQAAANEEKRRHAEDDLSRREAEQQRKEAELNRREAELTELTQRLRQMQEEQLRLQQEIYSLRGLLAHAFVRPASPRFVKDAQGNLLRVRSDNGQLFVTAPDGTSAQLQAHDGHLSFTDHHGAHQDVQEVHR